MKRERLKPPPLNTSKEAVALRTAAAAWAEPRGIVGDPHDREGQRRNRALLKAALKYAAAVERARGDSLMFSGGSMEGSL